MASALVPLFLSEWLWTCDGNVLCLSFPICRVGVFFLLGVTEGPMTHASHAEEVTDMTPALTFISPESLLRPCLFEREGSLTLVLPQFLGGFGVAFWSHESLVTGTCD